MDLGSFVMIARTVVALAVAGFAGLSTLAAHAQERQEPGHQSAHGPAAAPMRGPGEGAGGPRPGGPGPHAAPGRAEGGGRVGEAPGPKGPGPAIGSPAHGPQGQAFGQRPMGQSPAPVPSPAPAPAPAVRVPNSPAHEPGFDQAHRPGPAPHAPGVDQAHPPGPAPRSPQFDQAHRPAPAPHTPEVDQAHRPGLAQRAPLVNAPRAHGAVPAPYRGNIHRFVDLDARVWRGGRWHHDRHRGRFGWWWVVGGLWYFYPQPVYPYPDPFSPSEVDYGPGAAGGYWYYCESAGQYYPYVTDCPEGWVPVVPDQ